LRRHADGRAAGGTRLGVISQRAFTESVRRMKTAIDAGKIGAGPRIFLMFSWRDQAYYQSDPWRGQWATEGAAFSSINLPPARLVAVVHGEVEEVSGYGPTSTILTSKWKTRPWR